MELEAVLETVRERWLSLGISVRRGLSEEALADFEGRHHLRLHEELRDFYRLMDGMEEDSWDEGFNRFWPLSEVRPVPTALSHRRGIPNYGGIESSLPDASSFFVFADHSIWLNVYAVQITPGMSAVRGACPVVAIAGGDCWHEVAPSFGDFMRMYEESSHKIMWPWIPAPLWH
jgi:hypothetical protein